MATIRPQTLELRGLTVISEENRLTIRTRHGSSYCIHLNAAGAVLSVSQSTSGAVDKPAGGGHDVGVTSLP